MLLRGLRIWDCEGEGPGSAILAALNWVGQHAAKPGVINMSIGAAPNSMLDQAVENAIDAGFYTVVSAGNNDTSACGQSPARVLKAMTVAASNRNDRRWLDSNHGVCVDLYAPGAAVVSAWPGGGYVEKDGTSAAVPFVVGAAARLKEAFGDLPQSQLTSMILDAATVGTVTDNPPGTPNKLLYLEPSGPTVDPGVAFGYVYGNEPTTANYAPPPHFQRNAAGLTNTVTRLSAGLYQVHFPGLGVEGGIAHATAANASGGTCKVDNWFAQGGDQVVIVRCRDFAAGPADMRFSAAYTRVPAGIGGAFGHVWAAQKSAASYIPHGTWSYNSSGGVNTVTRLSRGSYQVHFPGLGVPGGTAMVSAQGTGPESCKLGTWFPAGAEEVVRVRCFDPAGAPVDAVFSVTFTHTRSILGTTGARGHAWVPRLGPDTPTHVPNPTWSFDSAGGTVTVIREGAGDYEVTFPGLAGSLRGNVLVTAEGSAEPANANRCQPQLWRDEGLDQIVTVHCRTVAGALADTAFTLQFLI